MQKLLMFPMQVRMWARLLGLRETGCSFSFLRVNRMSCGKRRKWDEVCTPTGADLCTRELESLAVPFTWAHKGAGPFTWLGVVQMHRLRWSFFDWMHMCECIRKCQCVQVPETTERHQGNKLGQVLHGWPREGAGMESKRESRFAGWWHLQLCREEVFTNVGCGCGCL